MIVIAGDSWALGEITDSDPGFTPDPTDSNWVERFKVTHVLHNGLEQYLTESGLLVTNLGHPGLSNAKIAQRLQQFVESCHDEIKKIFVFQTDYMRDYSKPFTVNLSQIKTVIELSSYVIDQYYRKLSEIARRAGCNVYVIGGVSDCLAKKQVEQQYPGVKVCCQSMVNLLINDNSQIDEPVLSWYLKPSVVVIEHIKNNLNDTELARLINVVDAGRQRQHDVFNNVLYFWPNGSHPNRVGFKKLFDYLVAEGYLKDKVDQ